MKRIIKIKTICDDDLAVSLYIDGKLVVKHLEYNTPRAISRLLSEFGISDDDYEIIDQR